MSAGTVGDVNGRPHRMLPHPCVTWVTPAGRIGVVRRLRAGPGGADTFAAAGDTPAPGLERQVADMARGLVGWMRSHDPEGNAGHKAVKVAVAATTAVAVGTVIGNAQITLFGSFGVVAMAAADTPAAGKVLMFQARRTGRPRRPRRATKSWRTTRACASCWPRTWRC